MPQLFMELPLVEEAARVEERGPAFRRIFQLQSPEERESRVALALDLVNRGELDPAGIVVVREGEAMVGAMLAQLVPGASGLVWPPQCELSERKREWEDRLVRYVVAWLRGQGAKLAQALMQPHETPLTAPLERNGFAHITRLWYLRRPVRESTRPAVATERLTYRPYLDSPDHFHQTLMQSYEGTLDCPEVNGVRDVDEIITGHRSQGVHDPALWQLALENDRPIGVLMMTVIHDWSALEVSYVGVTPEARRRGFGRELMIRALTAAESAGVNLVTLSVDERNRPAWDLYVSLGFEPYEHREVYLAVWKFGAT